MISGIIKVDKVSGVKVCLLEKFVVYLSFKRLHRGVWCLHQLQKMSELQARSRSTRAIFFPRSSSCCVGLVVRFLRGKMWEG